MQDQALYENLRKEEIALEERLRHIRELMKFYAPREAPKHSQTRVAPKARAESLGLRDSLRAILSNANEGLRPVEAAEELERKGFVYGGSTPLKQVVSTELYRMEQTKQLSKKDGRYMIRQS